VAQLTEARDAMKVSDSKVSGRIYFALRPSLKRIEVLAAQQAAAHKVKVKFTCKSNYNLVLLPRDRSGDKRHTFLIFKVDATDCSRRTKFLRLYD
jgi:hypothetical protein